MHATAQLAAPREQVGKSRRVPLEMDQAYFDRNKFEAFYLLPRERINGTETEASLVLHLHRNGAGDVQYFCLRHPAPDYYNLTVPSVVLYLSLSVKLTTPPKFEFGVL